MGLAIALFPGLSTVQFLSLTVCKNGGGRSGRFSHVYDNRYTEGRHGGGAGGGEGSHTPRCKIRGRGGGAPDHCESRVDQSIEQQAVLMVSFKCLGQKSLAKLL